MRRYDWHLYKDCEDPNNHHKKGHWKKIKVVKNEIEIPPKKNGVRSKWLDTVEKMKCGDSVAVKSLSQAKSLCYVLRYHGNIATQRKINPKVYMVWKKENL